MNKLSIKNTVTVQDLTTASHPECIRGIFQVKGTTSGTGITSTTGLNSRDTLEHLGGRFLTTFGMTISLETPELLKNTINTDQTLIYADLTYKVRGAIFNVYNNLGYGHKEQVYQKALATWFAARPERSRRDENWLYRQII